MDLYLHPQAAGRAFAATMPGLDYDKASPEVRTDLDRRGRLALEVLTPHIEAAVLAQLQADYPGQSGEARNTRTWLYEREQRARGRASRRHHPSNPEGH